LHPFTNQLLFGEIVIIAYELDDIIIGFLSERSFQKLRGMSVDSTVASI